LCRGPRSNRTPPAEPRQRPVRHQPSQTLTAAPTIFTALRQPSPRRCDLGLPPAPATSPMARAQPGRAGRTAPPPARRSQSAATHPVTGQGPPTTLATWYTARRYSRPRHATPGRRGVTRPARQRRRTLSPCGHQKLPEPPFPCSLSVRNETEDHSRVGHQLQTRVVHPVANNPQQVVPWLMAEKRPGAPGRCREGWCCRPGVAGPLRGRFGSRREGTGRGSGAWGAAWSWAVLPGPRRTSQRTERCGPGGSVTRRLCCLWCRQGTRRREATRGSPAQEPGPAAGHA